MTNIQLDRQFSNWNEKDNVDPESYQWFDHGYGALDWSALLKRRRVVILAEAGSGKSTEFRAQKSQVSQSGAFAFIATVKESAAKDFVSAIGLQAAKTFEAWKASDSPAWIFLDSVDEAKVRGLELESALVTLAHSISGAEHRTHIVISGRYSDWEYRRDLETLNRTLPTPETRAVKEEIDPNVLVINAARGKKLRKEDPVELPTVVVMLPLDSARMERYARAKGVQDVDAFSSALSEANLRSFARRPLDLQWLVSYWKDNGSFGTLRKMLSLNLTERLKETNASRSRVDELPREEAMKALRRIGAALVLQRVDSIMVPDETVNAAEVADALSLEEALPDMSGARRSLLITRPVFDPANAGFVRLHNDNEGVVRSFLAAAWMLELRAANCPIKIIHELLFGDTYGLKPIKPSMRETAAWLAITEADIAKQIIERDPWTLLQCGDPGSLKIETRVDALSAVLNAINQDDYHFRPDKDALRRFSTPELAPFINEQWERFKHFQSSRELLVEIVWLGKLGPCSGIALEAAYDGYSDRYTPIFGGRALLAAAQDNDRKKYAEHIVANAATIPEDVFWDGVESMYPSLISTPQLVAALAIPSIRHSGSPYGLEYNGPALAKRTSTSYDAVELLRVLTDIAREKTTEDATHPLLGTIEICALRLLDLSLEVFPPAEAVDAAIMVARAERDHHPRLTARDVDLLDAMRSTVERRRSVFWRVVDTLTVDYPVPGSRISHDFHFQTFGIDLRLGAADVDWLLAEIDARTSDQELIAHVAMRIWKNNDEDASLLTKIQGAAHPAAMQAVIGNWLSPPEPSEEMRKMEERNRERLIEGNARSKEIDQSWIDFANELRADPTLLRSAIAPTPTGSDWRLVHLWRMLAGLTGRSWHQDGVDLERLNPLLGPQVVAEFESALIRQWRQWKPTLRVDREIGQWDHSNAADTLGAAGLHLEISENKHWARTFSDDEIGIAARYALQQIGGLPTWFEQLCEKRPLVATPMLLHCVDKEWYVGPLDEKRRILDALADGGGHMHALIANDISLRLGGMTQAPYNILKPALKILQNGLADKEQFKALMLNKFRADARCWPKSLYLGKAFALDPEIAAQELEVALSTLDRPSQKELAEAVLPTIFAGRREPMQKRQKVLQTATLAKLVRLAFETVSVAEDNDRSNGKVYSPNPRDDAESARSAAFGELVNRPGLATFQEINRMRDEPGFPVERGRLTEIAFERAAKDSESAPWTSSDVRAFELDFAMLPRTSSDLQRVALSKIDDLSHELINGDYNQGAAAAKLGAEAEVQNWFADALEKRQGKSYSLMREPHVSNENEPDIRLDAKQSNARIPIEIKVAESWTLKELETGLVTQLMGRYLKNRKDRWGILLVVHKAGRPKGWFNESGVALKIDEVIEHLQAMARTIAASSFDSAQMVVALIDVSTLSEPKPPRLPKAQNLGPKTEA